MIYLLKPLRLFVKALVGEESPNQMAWGCALGVWVGLVPKDNLLAIVLGMLLCALRVNLFAGLATALFVSLLSVYIDPASHYVGHYLLSLESMQQSWEWLYNQPVAPWTSFNNTVVLGSFVIGAVALYPVKLATLPLFRKYLPIIGAKLKRYKIVQALAGAELTGRLSLTGE